MASLTQVSAFNLFLFLLFVVAWIVCRKRLMFTAIALPTRSRDDSISSYLEVKCFVEANHYYSRVPTIFSPFLGCFAVYLKMVHRIFFINKRRYHMNEQRIACVVKELWKELPIIAFSISSLFRARSGRQFEWVSWCTVIGFKIRGNCELVYNWVVFLNGHCIS